MKKRNRILLAVVVVAVGGGLAGVVLREPPEPVYQGKKLSVWLEDCGCIIDGNWVARTGIAHDDRAILSIKEIGTNAVPCLVELLGRRRSRPIVRLNTWVSEIAYRIGYHSEIRFYRHRDDDWHAMALIGLEALGCKAMPCIPTLTAYVEHDTNAFSWTGDYARVVLYKLAPDSRVFKSPGAKISVLTYIMIYDQEITNRQSAVEALAQMGEEARGTTRAIIECAFTDTANQVRTAATNALKRVDPVTARQMGWK